MSDQIEAARASVGLVETNPLRRQVAMSLLDGLEVHVTQMDDATADRVVRFIRHVTDGVEAAVKG